jgi:hypothetical protein
METTDVSGKCFLMPKKCTGEKKRKEDNHKTRLRSPLKMLRVCLVAHIFNLMALFICNNRPVRVVFTKTERERAKVTSLKKRFQPNSIVLLIFFIFLFWGFQILILTRALSSFLSKRNFLIYTK